MKRRNKKEDMPSLRDGGGESLLQVKRRAQPEAGTSGRVQSVHDPQPCEERGEHLLTKKGILNPERLTKREGKKTR